MAQSISSVHADVYPENLGETRYWNCNLPDYRRRLENYNGDLFGDELRAQLELYQLASDTSGSQQFDRKVARTDSGLSLILSDYTSMRQTARCQHL